MMEERMMMRRGPRTILRVGFGSLVLAALACSSSSNPTDEGGGNGTPPPTSGFRVEASADKVAGAIALKVKFNANVLGASGGVLFAWNFGDDSVATEENNKQTPEHTYLRAGEFTAKVRVTDATGAVAESEAIVIRTRESRVDLRVTEITVGADVVQAGESLAVQVKIANDGTEASEPTTVAVYLSTTQSIDQSLPAIGTITVPAIAAGQEVQLPEQASPMLVPASRTTGNYYLSAVVDPDGAIGETDEGNNGLIRTQAVRVGGVTANVDLTIPSISIDRAAAFPGDSIRVSYAVKNEGVAAAAPFHVKLFLSPDATFEPTDMILATESITSLPVGQTAQKVADVVVPQNAVAANYTVFAVADLANTVAETNESNNRGEAALRIYTGTVPGTELVVSNVTISPSSVMAGGTVTVSYKVQNRGDQAAAAFTNRLVLSSTATATALSPSVGTDAIASLAGNGSEDRASITATIPANTAGGDYYIGVVADATNVVTELIETNNIATSGTKLTVRTTAAIDLAPIQVGVTPTLVKAGDQVTVTATVKNNGADPAGAFKVQLLFSADTLDDVSDTVLATVNVPSLAGGATHQISQAGTVPLATNNGEYFVIVKVDSASAVQETNETNNRIFGTTPVQIYGGGGCASEDATEPNDFKSQATALTGSTFNAGLYSCKTNEDWFKVTLTPGSFLAAQIAFKDSEGALNLEVYGPGASTPVGSSSGYGDWEKVVLTPVGSGGEYVVRVLHDDWDNTKSNGYALSINVGLGDTGKDLVGAVTALGAPNKLAGEATTVSFKTLNVGTEATGASFGYKVYLASTPAFGSDKIEIGTGTISALAAGGAAVDTVASVTIPSGTVQGTYYVGVVLDSASAITEYNENNNLIIAPQVFKVGPACVEDAYEPNDTSSVARTLGDGTFPITICGSNEDWFKIGPLKAGQQVTLRATGPGACTYYMYLYKPNGTTSVDYDYQYSGTATPAEIVNPTISETGVHYVKLYNSYGSTCASGQTVSVVVTGSEVIDLLPRDGVAQPRPVTAGEDAIVDWTIENFGAKTAGASAVKFVLTADQTVDVSDTVLAASVAVPAMNGITAVTRRDKLTIPLAMLSGDYYIAIVVDTANAVTEANENNNTIFVPVRVVARCTADSGEASGANNTIGTAESMSSTSGTARTMCLADEDWYEVSLTSSQTLQVAACFTHANGDIDVDVYDDSGTLLKRSAGLANNEILTQAHVTGVGTYFVRVYGVLGQVSNSYTLKVSKGSTPLTCQ
jgi:subtilase family serine protease